MFSKISFPIMLLSGLVLVILVGLLIERSFLPETTSEMRVRAREFGEEQGKERPPRDFHFDGCTLFPDGLPGASYGKACLEHDIAYWFGGTDQERLYADLVFRHEVAESGPLGPVYQYPIYWAVRMSGDSWLAERFNAHWGFGYRE